MTDHTIGQFKRQLEQLLAELSEANLSARESAATVDLDQSRVGRLSRMDAMQNQALAQSALENRLVAIRDVEAALARIAAGEYGFCLACDEEIDPRRLSHNPAAACCISCTEKQEQSTL